jgi:alpha-tubulin suppressor-like RCC1 family protein
MGISSGWDYSCAVTLDGDIGCWGLNMFGQTDIPYHITQRLNLNKSNGVDVNYISNSNSNSSTSAFHDNISIPAINFND